MRVFIFLLIIIHAIAKQNNQLDIVEIVNIKDPFVSIKKSEPKKQKSEPKFELGGIFDNSAYINNTWVDIGTHVEGFKLILIQNDSVVLQMENRTKVLRLFEDIIE